MSVYIKELSFLFSEPGVPFSAYLHEGGSNLHWHTYIELIYIIKGSLMIKIDQSEYLAQAGDFFILNAQEIHSTSPSVHNMKNRHLVIQFEPSVIDSSLGSITELKYIIPFLKNEASYVRYTHLNEHSELKKIMDRILVEFKKKEMGFELEIKGNIYRIFAWLIRNRFINADLSNSHLTNLVSLKPLFEFIENNYYENITLDQAAKLSCMSYSYFSRYFKKATGKNFIEYVNFVRMIEAKKQLVSTNKNIAEIAQDIGFSNASYFIRLFKKENGISPHDFKKQNSATFTQN